MKHTPTSKRWQRVVAKRRSELRRLLGAGAAVGFVASIAALAVLADAGADDGVVWIARLALVLPAIIFVAWWVIGPGVSAEDSTTAVDSVNGAEALAERMQRIEHVFDTVAVPAAKRMSNSDEREWFRSSIRPVAPNSNGTETWALAPSSRAPGKSAEQG